jgi:putative ABC transport system permease protein
LLRNYLKVTVRCMVSQWTYSLINVAGLSIGMAACLVISLFVADELSWDRFHEKGDRIYRLVMQWRNTHGEWGESSNGQFRVRDPLVTDFPEFEHVIRVRRYGTQVSRGDLRFTEKRFFFADHGFFDVFTFPLVAGTPETALKEPFSVVLTPETARRYFENENPIGKTLTFNGMHDLKVTGIVSPAPVNAHFHFDMIVSMSTGEQTFRRIVKENWGEGSVHVYALASEGFDPDAWADRMPEFIAKHIGEGRAKTRGFRLESLNDIHLRSHGRSQYEPGGDITYVYAFSAIAVFILLIACFNFMNLSTARSAGRSREVGVRKVIGATRYQLAGQFLAESILLAIISVSIAVGIVELALPHFNVFLGKSLALGNSPALLALLSGTALLTGLIAGSYPAFLLSSFDPVHSIKGRFKVSGGSLRKVLVTSQFAISIFLVILTAVVQQQIAFTRGVRLGYDKDHVIVVHSIPESFRDKVEEAKRTFLDHRGISHVALTSRYPSGRLGSSFGVYAEGLPDEENQNLQTVWVGYDFVEALDLPVAAGRSFDNDHSEAYRAFMLNESAVRGYGWTPDEAVGKQLNGSLHIAKANGQWEEVEGTVVGVVKDVYFENLREPIKPMVYFLAPRMAWNMLVRVRPDQVQEAVAHLEQSWPRIHPDHPINYTFLDERFDRLYRKEALQGQMFGGFAGLAVFVACLGLVGLASFSAEKRTKEIGVRRVLGASVRKLVMMMSSEFTILVVVANVIAWPVAWYLGELWLSSFVYRTNVGPLALVGGSLLVLTVALLTVIGQAIRAALSNPIDALRYE